jgi:hypothetical protein
LDYYKIISISRPILARENMGLDFVSGQYGCLFSRCRKYVFMRGTLFFYHFIRILFYIKVKLTFRSTYYLFNNYRLIHGHYKIISISRPILARENMGLDFVSGQYGCLFSRCRKYVINSLIHGHFHIGLE